MSTIKTFFEKNHLNRGYDKNAKKVLDDSKSNVNTTSKHFDNDKLFSMEIMKRWEEISPGVLKKIVEMAAIEQKHRHEIEARQKNALEIEMKLGRYFAVLVICIISITTFFLAYYGYQILAGIFAGFAFSAIYGASRIHHNKRIKFDRSQSSNRRGSKNNFRKRKTSAEK